LRTGRPLDYAPEQITIPRCLKSGAVGPNEKSSGHPKRYYHRKSRGKKKKPNQEEWVQRRKIYFSKSTSSLEVGRQYLYRGKRGGPKSFPPFDKQKGEGRRVTQISPDVWGGGRPRKLDDSRGKRHENRERTETNRSSRLTENRKGAPTKLERGGGREKNG